MKPTWPILRLPAVVGCGRVYRLAGVCDAGGVYDIAEYTSGLNDVRASK